MNQIDLQLLRTLTDSDLLERVILPLLNSMGYRDVRVSHGPREGGVDIVFIKDDALGRVCHYAAQVKRFGSGADSERTAISVIQQLRRYLDTRIVEHVHGHLVKFDGLFLFTPDPVPQRILADAARAMHDGLQTIQLIDGPVLLGLIAKYLPGLAQELACTPVGYPRIALKELHIEQIRCFQDVSLSFRQGRGHRSWTALLGDNGMGKSTVLQCIALAALGPELASRVVRFPERLVRSGTKSGVVSCVFELSSVSGEVQDIAVELIFGRGSREVRGTIGGANQEAVVRGCDLLEARKSTEFDGWLVVGYGASRNLWFTEEPSKRRQQDPVVDRVESLFDPSKLLIDPGSLGRLLSGDGSPFVDMGAPSRLPSDAVNAVRSTLNKLVPAISCNDGLPGGELATMFGPVPLSELSDGCRSTLAWLVHLLVHILRAGKWTGDLTAIQGIVLIDEIDLHLHPQWQRVIIRSLKEAFPKLQFVVSSHSPMTVAGLDAAGAEVALLEARGEAVTIRTDLPSIRGWRADQILTSVLFDLPTSRDIDTEALLKEYADRLNARGPGDDEVRVLGKKVSELLDLEGEGVVDQKTYELLNALLEERFKNLDGDTRRHVLARAGLMIAK